MNERSKTCFQLNFDFNIIQDGKQYFENDQVVKTS